MKEFKTCKGIGKAKDFKGCGEMLPKVFNGQNNHQYGLGKSCGCFKKWLFNTDEGRDYITKRTIKKLPKIKQDNFNKLKQKVYPNGKTDALEDEINKLSRMIDNKLGYTTCIDCDKPLNKEIHAAHYHNKGSYKGLKYNLHILHSARAHCNRFSSEHKVGYYEGLKSRYGQEYADFVKVELPKMYNGHVNTSVDKKQAIKQVRAIIRNFDTYQLTDGKQARKLFNLLIGLYNE